MVFSREQTARNAEKSNRFGVGMCQLWARTMAGAASAGDQDGDGDADAVDGWRLEPEWACHYGDRNPPRGVLVAFFGGSRGFGHRAVSLGGGRIKSTDVSGGSYTPGVVGVTTIAQIERVLGVSYRGWSETVSGKVQPGAPADKPEPKPEPTQGKYVDIAADSLKKATGGGRRGELLAKAKRVLSRIKPV